MSRIALNIAVFVLLNVPGLINRAEAKSGATTASLEKGDSLYAAKQYTQAFDQYLALYQSGAYSAAMLLKMAYIQEGLSHLGESLYYLNLYYLASDDPQALKKMEELAEKNHLQGYEPSQSNLLFNWLQENYLNVTALLAFLNLLLLALLFYRRQIKMTTSWSITILFLLLSGPLFLHVNYGKDARRGIVARPLTYLMSGPSSGSSVVAIIGEGHQLHIKGHEDLWLKVEWEEKEVFVREFLLRPVRL